MKKKTALTLLACFMLTISIATTVSARPVNDVFGVYMRPKVTPPVFYNHHEGYYATVNVGAGLADDIKKSGRMEGGFVGPGIGLTIGRQFTKNFAIEGSMVYYSIIIADLSIYGLSTKFILPVGHRVSMFAKLGIAHAKLRVCFLGCETRSRIAPSFGLGFGVAINQDWSTTLEYNGIYLSSNNSEGVMGGLTIGATYHLD